MPRVVKTTDRVAQYVAQAVELHQEKARQEKREAAAAHAAKVIAHLTDEQEFLLNHPAVAAAAESGELAALVNEAIEALPAPKPRGRRPQTAATEDAETTEDA